MPLAKMSKEIANDNKSPTQIVRVNDPLRTQGQKLTPQLRCGQQKSNSNFLGGQNQCAQTGLFRKIVILPTSGHTG